MYGASPMSPARMAEALDRIGSVFCQLYGQTECAGLDDGWLRTGDVAVRDAEGYLYIVDRKKDMIVSGGFNIFPREVEDEIIHLVRDKKGPVYAPKSVEFLDALPLTPVGKADKKALRARYWAGQTRNVH
jgi:fatty-acyl-CoA synthase